jgi:hypothetical protein
MLLIRSWAYVCLAEFTLMLVALSGLRRKTQGINFGSDASERTAALGD